MSLDVKKTDSLLNPRVAVALIHLRLKSGGITTDEKFYTVTFAPEGMRWKLVGVHLKYETGLGFEEKDLETGQCSFMEEAANKRE